MDSTTAAILPRAAPRAADPKSDPKGDAPATAKPKISSDFETFLKMLTTQMKNQDPLNPIESADYAVQLATFSGVEQQVRTNDLLEGLATSLGQTGIGQLANWVGMEVRAAAPGYYEGKDMTLLLTPKPGADKSVLVVTDAKGRDVARAEVAPMAGPLSWPRDVKMPKDLPNGAYSFRLENWDGAQSLGDTPIELYARVTEAQVGKDGTQLVLSGGITIAADQVTAMRLPQAAS